MSTATPLSYQSPTTTPPRTRTRNFGLLWPLLALVILLGLNYWTPGFYNFELRDGRVYGSVIDILNRASPVLLMAAGMTLVIATGGVDLSVGAVVAVAGAVSAVLITKGTPVPVALAVALVAGTVAGMWNGVLVALLDIQPFVATLILMVAGRGVAQLIGQGQIITVENDTFTFIANGAFLGLPFPVTIAACGFLLAGLLTRRTALGLFIEAVGNNPTASRYAGVPARVVKFAVYAFSGFCAGVAGIIVASNIKAADANNAGLYTELDAILAVVVGGTALSGGRFSLVGSIIGALIIQTLTTTILTRGVPIQYTYVVKGLVVVIVCLLHSAQFRRAVMFPFTLPKRLRAARAAKAARMGRAA